ncbi:DUF7133 domain-containing protein [Flavicella sediminum]|uniref:DUF7133 domain-containing protein n=1 Tax=Flavicella sediminum TaxID=2585141 RepID=UPI0011237609|nr:c-type cytochrome [Flavicella sediminum]
MILNFFTKYNLFKPSTLIILLLLTACSRKNYDEPKVSLENYEIEEGFQLDVIASEPFIEAPVAMDFDNKGRIWTVEMKGYMQNLEGTGEEMPNGRITILEDWDNDGITDHTKIFMDGLVLPRAIAHVYGGLLYAEPPNLWFVDIENDKPINKVLVDANFTHGGNVEHQPNGLMLHLDNWIYNAKSSSRYQRKNGKWLKEKTSFRGQWGISKDNFGRIYFNNNSAQLRGDLVLPNTHNKNQAQSPKASLAKYLTTDQRVYPLHATAVNRGYVKGNLDKDSLLIRITAACGPVIYRGDQFPTEYSENAFVCAPEANLIKRNILTFDTIDIHAKQAIPKKEFIASTDEGFRPVNLFNGPDGNLYIVDMHRGILQDKAFLTDYLKNLYAKKELDTIIGMGRILKISRKNATKNKPINLNKLTVSEWLNLLKHKNGWIRDKAQHILIYRYEQTAIPMLKEMVFDTEHPITQLHALHTLNGLDALDFDYLNKILEKHTNTKTISHTLVLLEKFASKNHFPTFFNSIKKLHAKNNDLIDLYLANSLGNWANISSPPIFDFLNEIARRHTAKKIHIEGIVSSLNNKENEYLSHFQNNKKDSLTEALKACIYNKKNQALNNKKKKTSKAIKAGQKIFKNICATCHGDTGAGIDGLAPPFINSEYVSGSAERLGLILLHGLSGPLHVDGKLYELGATMPGLGNNPTYKDKDIQNLILYLQNNFAGKTSTISIEKIKSLRQRKPKSGVYTEEELLKIN